MRFQGKVALITGAGSGIGLATAKRFGSEGASVVIAERTAAKGEVAAEAVRAAGAPQSISFVCDVSREDQVQSTVQGTLEQLGRLDIVVNNAGLMTFSPILESTAEDWLKVLGVDLMGAFYFTREAFRHMGKGGAIVNVSSIHAVETVPQVAPYAAAKAALLSLTRSAAIEGAELGIRVNAILPGAVDTPMLWENPTIKSGLEKLDHNAIGKPEDIAAAIAYLASSDAAFIQGAAVRVDGGRLGRL